VIGGERFEVLVWLKASQEPKSLQARGDDKLISPEKMERRRIARELAEDVLEFIVQGTAAGSDIRTVAEQILKSIDRVTSEHLFKTAKDKKASLWHVSLQVWTVRLIV
jgi:hypothetical protein